MLVTFVLLAQPSSMHVHLELSAQRFQLSLSPAQEASIARAIVPIFTLSASMALTVLSRLSSLRVAQLEHLAQVIRLTSM